MENDFLKKITAFVEENLSDEGFGVSELAAAAGMSRSNLLRKVKSLTNVSVSLFIRQVRLKKAMEMLEQTSFNVSEVSYRVGFSSTSYFIKCFREEYGFPPGEVGKGASRAAASVPAGKSSFFQELKRRKVVRVLSVYAAAAFVILELMSIVIEPLGLPNWTLPMVIVLLVAGFIIAVIFSWIYDRVPEGGWKKTAPSHQETGEEKEPNGKAWKIASYLSFVVIIALIILQVLPKKNLVELNPDLEKSIAVLPFKNDSNDSTNVYLINGLMESILDNLQKQIRVEDVRKVFKLCDKYGIRKLANFLINVPGETKEDIEATFALAAEIGANINSNCLFEIK